MSILMSNALFLVAASFMIFQTAKAEAKDLRLVKPAHVYKGVEVMSASYIDVDSALLTSDGYIVFRSGNLFEITKGPRKGEQLFQNVQFKAIECSLKRWVTSRGIPSFKTSWRDYTRDGDIYDNDWPKNVEKILCKKSGIRTIPHRVGQVMFLNYSKKSGLNFSPMNYDDAVEMGLIK